MRSYRLQLAILLSLGIHLAAYGIWQQRSQTVIVTSEPAGQFSVAIVSNKASPTGNRKTTPQRSSTKTKQRPAKKVVRKMTPSPTKIVADKVENKSQSQTTAIKQTEPEPTTQENPAPTQTQTQQNQPSPAASLKSFALLNNDMLNDLNSKFQARFRYPMLARKRGWQGKVVLALNINLQGKIARIVVQKSSGYKILDRNAVKTFEAIGSISNGIQTHIQKPHKLNIPILYQLTGS